MAEPLTGDRVSGESAGREGVSGGERPREDEVVSEVEVMIEREIVVERETLSKGVPNKEDGPICSLIFQPEPESAVVRETVVVTEQVVVRQRVVVQRHAGTLVSVQSLLYVLVISLFAITFVVQPIRIPSGSMEPTLMVGDFLLMNKQSVAGDTSGPATWVLPPVAIQHGDIVVFHDPVTNPSLHLVKRVIGVPGDRIHLLDGVVYRNGAAVTEPYAVHRRAPEDTFRDDFPNMNTMDGEVNTNWWIRLRSLVRDGEITVPANSYFVMGDNRNDSEDSRYWGFVPRDAIVGKPFVVYFSFRQPGVGTARDAGLITETGEGYAGRGRWDIVRWGRLFKVVR
jgi:signal peptidase I